MTETVESSEAKTHLSEILVRVEAGEDFIIAHGGEPIARLTKIQKNTDISQLISDVRALRETAKLVTMHEILDWKRQGQKA